MITNVAIPSFDYDIEPIYLNEDMSNKLFCTFATENTLDSVLKRFKKGIRSYITKFLFFILKVRMNISVHIM